MKVVDDFLFEVGVSTDEHDGHTIDLVAVGQLLLVELPHDETPENCEVDRQDNS